MSEAETRVVIIGGAPARYTPAACAGLTTEVENWPGEVTILGPNIMAKMRTQADYFGTRLISGVVTEIDLRGPTLLLRRCRRRGLSCRLRHDRHRRARAVAWASERGRLRGFGLCATCDGLFLRGRHVVVAGGGNICSETASPVPAQHS